MTSELGKGRSFRCTARGEQDAPATTIEAASAISRIAAGQSGGLEVLLAEDNPVNQKRAKTLLSRLRHQVPTAANGALALKTFMTAPFDVVLMDMRMPIMDGLESTRRIRQWERRYADRRTPITAITAMTANAADRDRDREVCLQAGIDDHVAKPINRQALAEALAIFAGTPARDVSSV